MWKALNQKIFKTQRTSIWIMPDSQKAFVWDMVKHYLLMSFVFLFIVYVPPFASLFSTASVEDHQRIFEQFINMNIAKWPFWIVLVFLFVFYAIMLSHRIFGPLFKLRSYLEKDIQNGIDYPLSFREGDYHETLATVINDYKKTKEEKNISLTNALKEASIKYPDDPSIQAALKDIN